MIAIVAAAIINNSEIHQDSIPPVNEVHRAAIQYADLDSNKARSWDKKSKLQALLPRLQVEYERHMRDNINIDINDTIYVGSSGVTVGPGESSYARDTFGDQNVSVKAVWMLNELVFSRDQLDISSENRSRNRERQILLNEVTKQFYKRVKMTEVIKRLKKTANKNNSNTLSDQILIKQIEINETTANLDALTGGWFSRQIRE